MQMFTNAPRSDRKRATQDLLSLQNTLFGKDSQICILEEEKLSTILSHCRATSPRENSISYNENV
jgi:hypothetical protein